MDPITWTEIIAIGSIFLGGGGGVVALKKKGYTIIRKKPVPLAECPDPSCQSQVDQTAKDVVTIKNDIGEKLFPTLDELGKSFARIDERTILILDRMK